ncbi:MAG: extracellular solute-binding protein, partial [Candidatus Ornithospirochaeta sp.]
PITDLDGQHLSVLAQNSYYSTVDLRQARIIKEVQKAANVTIDWTLIDPTNYTDAVSPMLASGTDLPDIVLLPTLDPNQQYSSSGMFVALDKYFDLMPNFTKWLAENPEIKGSLTASDGHIYYVPTTNVTRNYQPVLMYNYKWLSDAGFDVPDTLDELLEVIRYYNSHDMNGHGKQDEVALSIQAAFLPYMFGPAFGLNFTSSDGFFAKDDGTVVYAQATPEYKEYLAFLNSMYKEGLLELEYTTLTRDQIIERFAQDKTGITYDFGWQSSMTYSPQLPYYDGTMATGVVLERPVEGPHGCFYVGRNAIGGIYGVNSDSDRIELAVKFLDYAMCEKNQEMYVWGIEGESYTVEPDGSKKYTAKASDNNWLQSLGINPAQVFPAQQSVEATDALVAKWHGEQDDVVATYVKSPWPFIYSTEDEAGVVSMYMVDIQTYVDEMAVAFVTGTTPLSEYDAYVDALNRMNLQDLLKVKQAQWDRYAKAMN